MQKFFFLRICVEDPILQEEERAAGKLQRNNANFEECVTKKKEKKFIQFLERSIL